MKMKKNNLLILAVAALGFAACANDETTAVNEKLAESNAISFRTLVGGQMRSADIDGAGLQTLGFKVFATETSTTNIYFSEDDFTWDGTSSYTSSTKHYWPSSGSLDFYAYAKNGSSTISHTGDTKVFVITPAAAAANQSDFVFANTNGKSKSTSASGVVLNFRHAMSKVTIKIKNSDAYLTATVKDVTLGYIDDKGTYTYSGSVSGTNTDTKDASLLKFADWANTDATKTSYVQTATTTSYTSATEATALPTPFILVPHTLTTATAYSAATEGSAFNGANVKVELKLQNTKNNAYIIGGAEAYETAMWNLPAGSWEPGKHYIYTVDVAGGGYYPTNHDSDEDLDPILEGAVIKFISVTVDDWTDFDGNDTVDGTQPINVPF